MQIKKTILTESVTLEELRKIIREGRAAEVLAVGDQIYIDFDDAAVPYDVIGIDADTPAAEELKHTVTIQAHELIEEHPFDTKGRYGSNDWETSELTAHWITEGKSSDDQNASAKNSVTFNYYGLECKISQSILANVVTLKMFTDLFVPMATEAMVKAIEIAIFNGTGEGQPLGVLKDNRVTTVVTLTPEEYASWSGWHKVKAKMKKAYRNGSFVMNQSTFDVGIDGMEDKNGQPIGRTNYGVNGEETYRFMGKNVETVEDDILPSWDDANEGDVIAVFMNFSDYVINTNMEMQVVKWTDHDNNKIKNKCLMVADGKVADAAGIILVKKGVKSV